MDIADASSFANFLCFTFLLCSLLVWYGFCIEIQISSCTCFVVGPYVVKKLNMYTKTITASEAKWTVKKKEN